MILVTLGTQDKDFSRLLKQVEKEIIKKNITEKVIVQAGHTKFESEHMEVFDYIPMDEFEKLMKKCSLLITHGGVGSIISGLEKNKPVIAAARLAKYKEHTNDHQKQIIEEFVKEGYILELKDFNKLGTILKKIKTFKGKKYQSNTHNLVTILDEYIEGEHMESLFKKHKEVIMYLVFGVLTTAVNIVSFFLLDKLGVNEYVNNTIAWVLAVIFAYITNKLWVFESKSWEKKVLLPEASSFFGARVLSYFVDMGVFYVMFDLLNINKMITKVFGNVIVIVMNYIISKLWVFKKVK